MLCDYMVKKNNAEGYEKCKLPAYVVGRPLCQEHYSYRFPETAHRLEHEKPCKRCMLLGLFRLEEGTKAIIVHEFKASKKGSTNFDESWTSKTPNEQKACNELCPDCNGRFWVYARPTVSK